MKAGEFEAFKRRMGWHFKWVSSYGNDFNCDYHVSFTQEQLAKGKAFFNYDIRDVQSEEMNGTSMFFRNEAGDAYHTNSVYARGSEMLDGRMVIWTACQRAAMRRVQTIIWLTGYDITTNMERVVMSSPPARYRK